MNIPDDLPTPPGLFRLYESGVISRDEFHRSMQHHHYRAFEEMEVSRRDPLTTRFLALLNRRAASQLVKQHGERAIRELFLALSTVPSFPPAHFLWNARHIDVPLHCFIRTKETPVFRILRLDLLAARAAVRVHHGENRGPAAMIEDFVFRRSRQGNLELTHRSNVNHR